MDQPTTRQRQRRAGGRRSARHRRRSPLKRLVGGVLGTGPGRGARVRTAPPPPGPARAGSGRGTGRRRWPVGLAVLAVVGILVAAVLVVPGLVVRDADPAAGDGPALAVADAVPQTTALLIRTDGSPAAAGVTLLAAAEDGTASATFIPSTTLVEIPGVGLDRLGLAHQYGGAPLVAATVENALGIQVDGTIAVADDGLAGLLSRVGGAELDIPDRLVSRAADGTGTVEFEAGSQFLNGVRLARYWSFEERGETEIDTFPRQQRALDALLRALDDADLRQAVLDPPAPELATDLTPAQLVEAVAVLGRAAVEESLTYQLLPVAPFGSADESLGASYQIRREEVADLVAQHLAGSVPDGAPGRLLAIQVLNGVGVPGIGQQVDGRLEGLPVRIVRTDNARSFDFPQTQVVVYEETAAVLDTARRVRDALGVGTILVSRQPQSVVDMTIVVGADLVGGGPAVPPGL